MNPPREQQQQEEEEEAQAPSPSPPRASLEQEIEAVLSRGAGVHVVPTFAGKPPACEQCTLKWDAVLSLIRQIGMLVFNLS